jgi:phosphopantothenoylcysteine synthetase/decarboxylase
VKPAKSNGDGRSNLLVGACGAGALLVLPDYLMSLQATASWHIRVVMTPAATRILPPATVRLACEDVYCDGPDSFSPGHVQLASWADHFILLPATAHTLARAACGLADDLLCTVLLAYERPAIFFPSMNLRMWQQPSVQRNVRQLQADGHRVVPPVMKSCWEFASASFRTGPALPGPDTVAQSIWESVSAPVPEPS